MAIEVKVPSVGESITEVYISSWLKQEGDAVAKDEPLVELETDKATVEVHAPVAGTLTKHLKKKGDRADVGEAIAQIEAGASKGAEPAAGKQVAAQASPAAQPADTKTAAGEAHVMPAAQRLLDEHGVAASDVQASGPGGRLLKEDVQRHVEAQAGAKQSPPKAAAPKAETAASKPAAAAPAGGDREEEVVPMKFASTVNRSSTIEGVAWKMRSAWRKGVLPFSAGVTSLSTMRAWV